jgi:hypothetical protein
MNEPRQSDAKAIYRGPDRRNLPKFICPICDTLSTNHVMEGRMDYTHGYYWRRHRCHACNEVFTTTQRIEPIGRPSFESQDLGST